MGALLPAVSSFSAHRIFNGGFESVPYRALEGDLEIIFISQNGGDIEALPSQFCFTFISFIWKTGKHKYAGLGPYFFSFFL